MMKVNHPDFEVLVVDNSINSNYQKIFGNLCHVRHVSPIGKNILQIIAESQNLIRDFFLNNDFTHLFMLESDLIPQNPDILNILLSHQKTVCGASYFIDHFYSKFAIPQRFIKDGTDYITDFETFENEFISVGTGLHKVFNIGFGCIVIERQVLEKIKFRTDGKIASDSLFAKDCYDQNIDIYLDSDIQPIPHYNTDWGVMLKNSVL